MPAAEGQKFQCECGAEITYTKACTCDTHQNPVCVCGQEMKPDMDLP